MHEKGKGSEPDFSPQDAWLKRFDRMRNFVRERTQGFDPVDVVQFQQFGHINVRIGQLDHQVENNIVKVNYFLGSESSLGVKVMQINTMEAKGWISLLGRIANGIDRKHFRTSDTQAIAQEILIFAKEK